ncbi:MAG: LAGLIDADG family homing endonuclease, partial [Candidatus Micrarchaeota archaeon]
LEGKSLEGIQVPTLDFDLKVGLKPLAGFVKHPERDKLVEITTKTGRKVTVTHDHSLFTATRDFKIAAIECNKLAAGDQIVIPAQIPCGFNDLSEISAVQLLPELRLENFEEPVRQAIEKIGWKQATAIAGVTSGDIYNYFRTSPTQQVNLPINSFNKLMAETRTTFEEKSLRIKNGTSTAMPAVIPVNEEFCRFLGYYVSEGYYAREKGRGGSVILTNSDEVILSDMKFLANSLFKINPVERKVHGAGTSTQLRISSSPLALFMERLGCGRTCTEKCVPQMIYGLSKNKIAAFLRALYSGDGCFTASKNSGNSVRYNTTSKKLAEDVAQLLLIFGIVARVYSPKQREKPNCNQLWIVEFKDREMVETFLNEIGFVQKKPVPIKKAWAHTKANTVHFDREALKLHFKKLPRKYRHLARFKRCSKNYLKKVVSDPACDCSEEIRSFATGDFYLDEITSVKEITLEKPEPVYDLSVSPSQNFVGGFGGILLHNTEAKALYEAMRVGAVGNVVMGTIHGESAYSIWDRVVNDLGVPTTSFKATDMCIISAPIRFKGSLKRERRVLEVTEVGKEWSEEPAKEGGFLQWMQFDASKDSLDLFKDNLTNSTWLKRVQRNRGMSFDDIWAEITGRAAYKQYLVDQKRKYDIPALLEAEHTVRAHNKYALMEERQREEIGGVEYESLLRDWKAWVDEELVRPLVALKKK